MLARLAWRNIFRNKRRTYITGFAIGVGLACLIFVDAIYIGMEENMIHNATASFMGEGQIQRKGFRETLDVDKTVNDLDDTCRRLEGEPSVDRFTLRTLTFSMVSSPSTVEAATAVGIDPKTERALSQIDEAIIEGNYLEGDNPRDILVGSKLAETLDVGLGDRVVLTATEAHTNEIVQELFRVSGIFQFGMREMDRAMVFIRLSKAQEMLNIDGQVHQIVLGFTDIDEGRDKDSPFWSEYSRNGNEAVGWAVLMPQLEALFELSSFSTFITAVILFSVVALGIINTLFMSLHERMFEFGVIRAIGTRPTAVSGLILLEAASLAIVSVVIGVAIGFGVTLWISKLGINYQGIEFAGVTFRERLYPVLSVNQFVVYPISVFVFTTLTGLFPAWRAARMSPAQAIRRSF